MKKKAWSKRIKEACVDAGTYKPYFDSVIDALAAVLERRDEANEMYINTGGQPIVKYTNKAGATNAVANPALVLWDSMNKTALTYWKELGLTPAGLKKIDDTALKTKSKDPFSESLSKLFE